MKENYMSTASSIVTDNPVFKIKLLDVDDRMEQEKGQEEPMKDELKNGEAISGERLKSDSDKRYKGTICDINKDNDGDIVSVVIIDERGKKVTIDPVTIKRLDLHDEKDTLDKTQGSDRYNKLRLKDFGSWRTQNF